VNARYALYPLFSPTTADRLRHARELRSSHGSAPEARQKLAQRATHYASQRRRCDTSSLPWPPASLRVIPQHCDPNLLLVYALALVAGYGVLRGEQKASTLRLALTPSTVISSGVPDVFCLAPGFEGRGTQFEGSAVRLLVFVFILKVRPSLSVAKPNTANKSHEHSAPVLEFHKTKC
jgi:hypothetical protein